MKTKVLIVEDNHVVLLVSEKHLKRYCDVEIFRAHNGREAFELVKIHRFSLILMDIQMPVMDGYDATRAIREYEAQAGAHTPIVAITAHDTREACLTAGMDDYAMKPADYERIVRRWLPHDVWRSNE